MPWIESHDDVGDHRKTHKFCSLLGVSVPEAVGHLHLLWHYTLRVSWESGDLTGVMPEAIAKACWWGGKPDDFITALQDSGLMDGMKVHDWTIYAREMIYQRKYRKNKRCKTAVKKVLNSCKKGFKQLKKRSTLPDLTLPNQTQPNQTKDTPNGVVRSAHTPQAELVDNFAEVYTKATSQPFAKKNTHFIVIAQMIEKHGIDACKNKVAVLAKMCSEGSNWPAKNGWADFTIENLVRNWNSIIYQEKLTEQEIRNKEFLELREKRRLDREKQDRALAGIGVS